MRRLWLLLLLLLAEPWDARCQMAPLVVQHSTAYEASHVFSGLKLTGLCVTWHTQAARWLEVFDATALPSNGAVTAVWCEPISAATSAADTGVCFDWGVHPISNKTGVTVGVSTSASGCTNLTADGANDWFNAQLMP